MDPSIVDNRDGEDGAAVAQKLREEMEWDRARADATRTRTAADRVRQVAVEVDRQQMQRLSRQTRRRKRNSTNFFPRTRTCCMR